MATISIIHIVTSADMAESRLMPVVPHSTVLFKRICPDFDLFYDDYFCICVVISFLSLSSLSVRDNCKAVSFE